MPFKSAIHDREYHKFVENPAGETSVRVFVSNEAGQELPILGDFNVKSPTGPLKRTVVTVTDTAADPLSSPQTNRVALTIRNKSATETIYLGESTAITPDDTTTGGWEIGPGEDFNIDYDDSNNFFLVTAPGKTAVVKILEIASSSTGGGTTLTGTMIQETPSGLIDGSNAVFTVSQTPLGASYFQLFLDGILQRVTTYYTRSGVAITIVGTPPLPGQTLDAVYWY